MQNTSISYLYFKRNKQKTPKTLVQDIREGKYTKKMQFINSLLSELIHRNLCTEELLNKLLNTIPCSLHMSINIDSLTYINRKWAGRKVECKKMGWACNSHKKNVLWNKNGYMKETQRIYPEKNMKMFLKVSVKLW